MQNDGRQLILNPNRAHTYHRPRGRVLTVIPPKLVASAHVTPEKTDIPNAHNSDRGVFELNIPDTYKSVMRKDYFTDNYVIIAPKRHLRPSDFSGSERRLVETASSPRLDLQPEVDSIRDRNGNWKTKVVDNKFPALTLDNPEAFGKQEIVIDTPLVNVPLGKVGQEQLATVLKTYQKRTEALLRLRGIKYVVVFKNDGVRAGASLAHAHSQIFATPLVPTKVAHISQAVENYFQKNNKNPYQGVLEFELQQKIRIIRETNQWVAFCPFAPRWPLDVWILPKSHVSTIRELSDMQLTELATVLYPIINRLTRYQVDYNFYLENGVSPNHRFTLKIQSRSLNWWAGFEVASDIAINPIPPEIAAEWYRSVK